MKRVWLMIFFSTGEQNIHLNNYCKKTEINLPNFLAIQLLQIYVRCGNFDSLLIKMNNKIKTLYIYLLLSMSNIV